MQLSKSVLLEGSPGVGKTRFLLLGGYYRVEIAGLKSLIKEEYLDFTRPKWRIFVSLLCWELNTTLALANMSAPILFLGSINAIVGPQSGVILQISNASYPNINYQLKTDSDIR
jgi:hypothetical protein